MSDCDRHLGNKRQAYAILSELAAAPAPRIASVLKRAYHNDANWFGSHPLNERHGIAAIEDVWRDMRRAFPDMERRDSILLGGTYDGADMVAATGHYQATFAEDWLGVPATHAVVHLRYGEVHRFVDGKIARTYALIDLLDLMRQAGVWPLPPSLGAEGIWPGPATGDGLRLSAGDARLGTASRDTVLAMHQAMFDFDGVNLDSMDQAAYWTEHFMWYGPAGIGVCRGMTGYQAHHQIPFLTAFPDRGGAGHYVCFGDGRYVVTGGWPSVVATHTGGGWLGLAATNKRVGMRVMDFYRTEGGQGAFSPGARGCPSPRNAARGGTPRMKIAENWVPIDVIDVLLQMGTDILARLEHLRGNPRHSL